MEYLDKSKANRLIFLCWLAYFVSYIGRLNYNASIVAVIEDLAISKSAAGIVSSYFFFCYGAGQLIHGILSEKYNPLISIGIALAAAAIVNIVMPLTNSISSMKFLWAINALAQSVLWTSIIKTLSMRLPENRLRFAVLVMSTSTAAGTFVAYGLSALFVYLHIWRAVFVAAAIILAVACVIWLIFAKPLIATNRAQTVKIEQDLMPQETQVESVTTQQSKKSRIYFYSFFAVFILCGIINGFIKDGITTWVPSILHENFAMPKYLSIILTLVLPLIAILGAFFAAKLYALFKDNLLICALCYALCVGFLFALSYTVTTAVAISMLIFALIACAMAAVNNVLTSAIPLYMRKVVKSGLAAGVINAACYVGSTLSVSLIGLVAEKSGWSNVMIMLFICSIFAAVVCIIGLIFQKKSGMQKF